ncbi:MAG: ArsR/SmtB family transcription factor [Candidatus Dormibacteria bacterium]
MKVELPVRQRGACCEVAINLKPAAVSGAVGLLKLLADPARLRMIAALRDASAPICICDFTGALGLSQPTISHHMGKLRRGGLVRVTRKGIWSFYELTSTLDGTTMAVIDSALAVGGVAGPA